MRCRFRFRTNINEPLSRGTRRTHRAPVRPLAGVESFVRLERDARAEALRTVLALVGLLTRVGVLVLAHLLHRDESPPTVLTSTMRQKIHVAHYIY